jgi:short subunit dehydrogenase-like uncharacterized protein
MIPMCGFDSVPSDLLAWFAVDTMRRKHSCPTARTDSCIYAISGAVSGGTLSTFSTSLDTYSLKELIAMSKPYMLSPRKPPQTNRKRLGKSLSRIVGLQHIKGLGWMAYTPQGL